MDTGIIACLALLPKHLSHLIAQQKRVKAIRLAPCAGKLSGVSLFYGISDTHVVAQMRVGHGTFQIWRDFFLFGLQVLLRSEPMRRVVPRVFDEAPLLSSWPHSSPRHPSWLDPRCASASAAGTVAHRRA
jgi:uncharacterized protein (DUF2336 family)